MPKFTKVSQVDETKTKLARQAYETAPGDYFFGTCGEFSGVLMQHLEVLEPWTPSRCGSMHVVLPETGQMRCIHDKMYVEVVETMQLRWRFKDGQVR